MRGVLAATFLAGVAAATTPVPRPADSARLPGGGVAGPGGSVGYFPAAKGGVEAIDLSTGGPLWASKEAAAPLAVAGGKLYARAAVPGKPNELRVVALDAKSGKRVLRSDAVPLPDWVVIGTAHGRSFALAARPEEGGLLLAWEARAWYAGGAPPPPAVVEAARKSASGAARVDLRTGKVRTYGKADLPRDLPKATAEPASATLGGRKFSVSDSPVRFGAPTPARRTLRATDSSGRLLWERAIAAPVRLLPLP